MKNIKNDIQILINLFNVAKFDLVVIKAKKLIKKYPEYVILYNMLILYGFCASFINMIVEHFTGKTINF